MDPLLFSPFFSVYLHLTMQTPLRHDVRDKTYKQIINKNKQIIAQDNKFLSLLLCSLTWSALDPLGC